MKSIGQRAALLLLGVFALAIWQEQRIYALVLLACVLVGFLLTFPQLRQWIHRFIKQHHRTVGIFVSVVCVGVSIWLASACSHMPHLAGMVLSLAIVIQSVRLFPNRLSIDMGSFAYTVGIVMMIVSALSLNQLQTFLSGVLAGFGFFGGGAICTKTLWHVSFQDPKYFFRLLLMMIYVVLFGGIATLMSFASFTVWNNPRQGWLLVGISIIAIWFAGRPYYMEYRTQQ